MVTFFTSLQHLETLLSLGLLRFLFHGLVLEEVVVVEVRILTLLEGVAVVAAVPDKPRKELLPWLVVQVLLLL
jgi:hypothetical protein